jgi:hypothetical protein
LRASLEQRTHQQRVVFVVLIVLVILVVLVVFDVFVALVVFVIQLRYDVPGRRQPSVLRADENPARPPIDWQAACGHESILDERRRGL